MDKLFILCDSPPLFMLVKHNRISAVPFTGLDADITPLFPVESRGEADGVSFLRKQIPVTPGFAITNYKSQGDTIERGILDLKLSSANTSQLKTSHKNYTSLNVQLGRIKSFAGLWLREPIQLSDLQSQPDPGLAEEVQRLTSLQQRTLTIWASAFR